MARHSEQNCELSVRFNRPVPLHFKLIFRVFGQNSAG
jgi:hypothetical protein